MIINDKSRIDEDVEKFVNFMKKHIIKKGEGNKKTITHTLMGPLHPTIAPFKGAYNIEGLDYETFMKLYKRVFGKMELHIVERPNSVGPMVIDIDFNVSKKHKERQYGDEHIEQIVEIYNELFKKYLDIDEDNIKAFVFEKPTPTYDAGKKIYKDGFHVIYPDIPLDVKKRYFFFDKVKYEVINKKLFSNIPIINTYDKILDASVVMSNGILMYGSHKEGREPYSLTKIYNNDMSIDSLDNYDDGGDLVSLLSLRRYPSEDNIPMKEKTKKNTFYREESEDDIGSESDNDSDLLSDNDTDAGADVPSKKFNIFDKVEMKDSESELESDSEKSVDCGIKDITDSEDEIPELTPRKVNKKKTKTNTLKKNKNNDSESGEEINDEVEKIFNKYASKGKKTKKIKDYIDDDEVMDDEIMDRVTQKLAKEHDLKYDQLSDIKIAKALIGILSKKRSKSYDDWIRVGWALHNVSTSLLPTFIEFSKKCKEKYEPGCCEKVWSGANYNKSGYTISSLHWWARCDNLEEYLKIMRGRVQKLVFEAQSGTHDDIANVVREMYKYFYKCVNITKNIWYEFQEHRWVCIDSAYTLSEKISTELTKEFYILHAYYLQEAAARESIEQDDTVLKSKKIQRIYEKLKTSGFVKSVVEMCSRKFYDKKRKFEEQLNTNKNLVGFENGVYDLKNGVFRNGSPDDLVSMSVGYDYIEFDKNDEVIQEIETYFSQVQREDDMRDYILRLISSFLDGRVTDQKFVLWTGSGCHAKDELIKMHDGTVKKIQDIQLGDYVMGTNGKRKVTVTYNGTAEMFKICAHDENKTNFLVNKNHRLALRSHFKPYISNTYDDVCEKNIYWVTYHANIDDGPTELLEKFYSVEDAQEFINSLEDNPDVIQFNEVSPMSIHRILYTNEKILSHYKLLKHNSSPETDCCFNVVKINTQEFYGIELDGNKQYIMNNGYVTYNSNGKSTTIDLIHNTLGEYSGVLPVTVLTKKRGASGAAIPELADKRGKRFLVIQEPEHDDTVYVGQMKELTAGNDKIYARALYGDPFTYKPQYKLVLICNRLPHIPSNDFGTWRRLRVTPWESEFVDFEPKEDHQFRKDYDLQEKMEQWGQPFIWLLANKYYPKYIKHGLGEPAKVTKFTNQYKKDSDFYCEFMTDFIEETNNDNDVENADYVYRLFKNWYKEAYSDKVPPKKDFTKYMDSKKLTVHKNLIHGIKVSSNDES